MQRSIGGITLNWCAAAAGGEDDILDLAKQIIPLIKKELENTDNLQPLKGIKGVFELNVLQQGKLKGSWHVELSGEAKAPEIKEGKATKKPTISATMSDDVMVKLASGKLQPMNAFMSGKIKLAGNIMMAQKLNTVFGSGNLAQKGRVIAQDFISKNEYLKAKL